MSIRSDDTRLADPGKDPQRWKYEGYPAFTEWMASSNDFLVLRRFSKTSSRVLLYLQHEITLKEKRLDECDRWTMSLPGSQGGCGSFVHDAGSPREKIIKELSPLLKEYCECGVPSEDMN